MFIRVGQNIVNLEEVVVISRKGTCACIETTLRTVPWNCSEEEWEGLQKTLGVLSPGETEEVKPRRGRRVE
jgi:hypothetical protein